MCASLRAGSPLDSPVRRRSLSRSRSRTPPRGGSAQQMHWKKKLDALFDRGVVRSSELDDRTLDALDGAASPPFRRCVQHVDVTTFVTSFEVSRTVDSRRPMYGFAAHRSPSLTR